MLNGRKPMNRKAALLITLAAIAIGPGSAWPQQTDDQPSAGAGIAYVAPFPENDTYKLQAYGDEFAEGLLTGLVEALASEPRIQPQRKHRAIGALIRPEWEDEIKAEEQARDVFHIGVVMLGLNDRERIRLGGKSFQVTTEEWQAEYGRRIDRLLKVLKKRGLALYLVGQPIMRNPNVNRDAEVINVVLRERALQNGIRFIDIVAAFADDGGGFSQFGPDLSGNRQKMREGDGVTFTQAGNRKLAHFVETEVRRDVAQAKAERAIPLAGSDVEQKKINPQKAQAAAAGWKGTVTKDGRPADPLAAAKAGPASQPAAVAVTADTSGDQKADNGRISLRQVGAGGREEVITLDILRPSIPAAVVALVTRSEVAERAQQGGDTITEDIGNGITLVSSISGSGESAAAGAKKRTAAGPSPYYTVLVRGERLAAKPGRADDFSWPRADGAPLAVPPPPAPAAKAAAPAGKAPAKAPPRT